MVLKQGHRGQHGHSRIGGHGAETAGVRKARAKKISSFVSEQVQAATAEADGAEPMKCLPADPSAKEC